MVARIIAQSNNSNNSSISPQQLATLREISLGNSGASPATQALRQQVKAAASSSNVAKPAVPTPPPIGVQQNDPAPIYRPYTSIGKPGRPGSTLYRGWMQASTQFAGGSEGGNPNNYRFVFHYNPPNFAFDLQAGKTSPILGTDQSIDPLTAAASVSLSFLINRQEEVASRTQTAHRVAHLQNFGDLGTMYDVEFLLRVCSGDPSPDSETAYNNWLKMNLIDVYFSPMVRFHGYVVDINVNHVMFNVYMIPTITEVQVSMTGIYDSTPSASADGDLNPFSGTDLVPVGANGVSAGVKQK